MLHFDVTYEFEDRTTTVQMRHRGGMLHAVDHTLREYPDVVVTITPLGDDDDDPTLIDQMVYRLVERKPGTDWWILRSGSGLSGVQVDDAVTRLLDKGCIIGSADGFKAVSDENVRTYTC